MKKQNIVTTYLINLDGFYKGGAITKRVANIMDTMADRAVACYLGHDMLIITAANSVINAAEIANIIIKQFEEHYTLLKIGEVSC